MASSLVSSLFVLLCASGLATPPGDPSPDPIVGGTDAEVCDFPATVAIVNGGGDQFCTGALVHPRVVMLAAHCIASQSPASVLFGESVFSPEASVPVDNCDDHPDFEGVEHFLPMDLAYCVLAADAPDVPIVPPLMGCEAEQLTPDAEVTLAGFGIDNEQQGSGNVMKRWTVNTVQTVDEDNNDLILLGVDGASACYGDSGGPAYMRLDDGSWRLVGITSESHPDVHDAPTVCGYGVIYDLVHLEMQWLEQATGFDVTPCFDADGTWSADETCGGFPNQIAGGMGNGMGWGAACPAQSRSGYSATCGEPFEAVGGTSTGGEDTDGETETDTDGPDRTTGVLSAGTAADGSSSGDGGGTSTPGSDGPDMTTSGTPSTGAAGSSSGGAGQGGDGDGGCGCRADGGGDAPWLLLFVAAAVRRRRARLGVTRTRR